MWTNGSAFAAPASCKVRHRDKAADVLMAFPPVSAYRWPRELIAAICAGPHDRLFMILFPVRQLSPHRQGTELFEYELSLLPGMHVMMVVANLPICGSVGAGALASIVGLPLEDLAYLATRSTPSHAREQVAAATGAPDQQAIGGRSRAPNSLP